MMSPAARRALGVAGSKDPEIAVTAALRVTPTMPAMLRYTGVLYEALAIPTLPRSARLRAADRLLITSALFGVVGGADPVPAYRLSAGSVLPGIRRAIGLLAGAAGRADPVPDAAGRRSAIRRLRGVRADSGCHHRPGGHRKHRR